MLNEVGQQTVNWWVWSYFQHEKSKFQSSFPGLRPMLGLDPRTNAHAYASTTIKAATRLQLNQSLRVQGRAGTPIYDFSICNMHIYGELDYILYCK